MLSLAGLYLVDSTTIRSMAMGAIIVVAVSILAAVTLLPVLMSLLGRRAYARGRIAIVFGLLVARWFARAGAGAGLDQRRPPPRAASGSAGRRRSRAGPWVSALGHRGACCSRSPSRRSRSTSATARCASSRRTTRRASAPSWRRRRARPGRGRSGAGDRELDSGRATRRRQPRGARPRTSRSCAATPRWRGWLPPQPSRDGHAALDHRGARGTTPRARRREALVDAAARRRRPAARRGRRAGGRRHRFNEDFIDLVSGSMWKILLFVLVFSYLVLFAAAALGAAAAEGRADEPAVGGRRLRRARDGVPVRLVRRPARLRLARLRERDDAAASCSRSCSGCRWTTRCSCCRGSASATTRPATPSARSPRASARAPRTISSAALIMVAVFARVRRHRHAVDQGDRRGDVGGDRARRDARPAHPGAGHHGDHGPLELVAAEACGPRAAARRLRVGAQAAASRRSISAASSLTAIRSCSSVSRSRSVTVSSSIVWWSTVTPQGVPISSWRR